MSNNENGYGIIGPARRSVDPSGLPLLLYPVAQLAIGPGGKLVRRKYEIPEVYNGQTVPGDVLTFIEDSARMQTILAYSVGALSADRGGDILPPSGGGAAGLLGLAGLAGLAGSSSSSTTKIPAGDVPPYDPTRGYLPGELARFNGKIYVSRGCPANFTPANAPSKWGVFDPKKSYPAWEASKSYKLDDIVTHRGNVWIATLNPPTTEPGGLGWSPIHPATFLAQGGSDPQEVMAPDPAYRLKLPAGSTAVPVVYLSGTATYASSCLAIGAGAGAGQVLLNAPEDTGAVGDSPTVAEHYVRVVTAGSGTGVGVLYTFTLPGTAAFIRTPKTTIRPLNAKSAACCPYAVWSADGRTLTVGAGVDPGATATLIFAVELEQTKNAVPA